MSGIFKIVKPHLSGQEKKDISVGIDLRVGDKKIPCRVTKSCESYEELSLEVKAIQHDLERILQEAKGFFGNQVLAEVSEVTSDMSAEEIWSVLSQIESEDQIKEHFNGLDENKRKEVAEHVLTHCNVFSGTGAFFSRCYNSSSGFIE
jgi:tRNA(Met) C34 N-acetyltransferase TmcA